MDQKLEFVTLALQGRLSISELCRRFEISRRTGYKWIGRYKQEGESGLKERSRRPHSSPKKTNKSTEEIIIGLRNEHPEWGAKKLRKLLDNGIKNSQYDIKTVPACSTINKILKDHDLTKNPKRSSSNSWKRFEYDLPNELWQMDFKGSFKLNNQRRCYPLTITDDCSRYNITLTACENETYQTVYSALVRVFEKYGLPEMILSDNGNPWGVSGQKGVDGQRYYTKLEKWLMQLRIKVIHGRAYHPQTQGKEERFHRTLKTELLNYESFKDHNHCQKAFDKWRYKYNHQRPHESLNLETPSSKYTPSLRSYPSKLHDPEYDLTDQIRRVNSRGYISFKGKRLFIGEAFKEDYIAIRKSNKENIMNVFYCNTKIKKITL